MKIPAGLPKGHCSYFSLAQSLRRHSLPYVLRTSGDRSGKFPCSKEVIDIEYGVSYLKKKLAVKQKRVDLRYKYYEMKNSMDMLRSLIPEEYKCMSETLGWCAKAVDSLADRTVFDTFDQDDFQIMEIFRLNNGDILFDSAVLSSLISACSFIYVGKDADSYPVLQVVDGGNATGIIDPVTNLLTEGYAILQKDEQDNPILEAYFRPYRTDYYVNGRLEEGLTLIHQAPYAMLVPIIHRPDARRTFGHSRISRACMNIQQGALRTLLRSEVSAEFYSFPQKYVLGLSEAAEFNNRSATMSSFLDLPKDEEGNKPSVGQFSQQSMSPYIDQMKMFASLFAAETGLTLDDLGFPSANPSSSDAIKASHEQLRLTARKAQRTFGSGFLNAGYLAACLRDNAGYERRAFANTTPLWMPVFEPDASGLGVIGDAIIKINQAVPDFLTEKHIRQMTGLKKD